MANHDERRPGRFRRWMYRTGRPNRLAAALNRIDALAAGTGLWDKRIVTLEVRGRRTGRLLKVPVVPVVHDGHRYFVAMLGKNTNWVSNVRASGGRAVIHAGSWENVRLIEVAAAQRPPILTSYLKVAPGARAHIPVDHRSNPTAFADVAADIPVFEVCRDDGATPPAR